MRDVSQAFWIAVPVGLSLICILLGLVPVGVGTGGTIAPIFTLAVVYFFSVHRPEFFPPWAVFFIGLLQDIMSGGPLGLYTVVLLAAYGLTHSQRLFLMGRGFSTLWVGFLAICAIAAVIMWFGASVHYGIAVNPLPLLWQAGITALIYPPVSFILTRINRQMAILAPAA
ncbi:Rod shape-determining protein MreD [Candidatus Phaeomarinobacter ectocarpi]|uniref:Rod shape-determining protein MreD n=1 Tax=Candidatus Phaeomarinibacter ectocarpi TaxID=1458461 RepID=X5MKJ2_9HYPH|nr:rod shape-determining protein MreD [Candidatus Phaeomarinobacter ectocarpi]CDO58625.1 Rod shape-determining protein MreD [Candidatus Phaeomarinobacter ectocarpi]